MPPSPTGQEPGSRPARFLQLEVDASAVIIDATWTNPAANVYLVTLRFSVDMNTLLVPPASLDFWMIGGSSEFKGVVDIDSVTWLDNVTMTIGYVGDLLGHAPTVLGLNNIGGNLQTAELVPVRTFACFPIIV